MVKSSSIDSILAKGDILSGHRTRRQAQELMPDFARELGLTNLDPTLKRKMEDFVIEVVLGAAWYTRKYKSAYLKTWFYIACNGALVIGMPVAIYAASRYSSFQWTTSVAQFSGLLTGVFAMQKMLSAWFAQQQQYATWYQCSSDLKQIYYELLRQHGGAVAGSALADDLDAGTIQARKVMDTERLGFYQRLALPSMDVLDMLTASSASTTSLVSSLLPAPGATTTKAVTVGTKTIAGAIAIPAHTDVSQLDNTVTLVDKLALQPSPTASVFDATTVARCAGTTLSGAADINALFQPAGGFFKWYNQTMSGKAAFTHRGAARNDSDINAHFNRFWDLLSVAFGKDPISFVEFCALMAINLEETTGNLTAAPEEVNGMHSVPPGLAYAFNAIPGLKQSYNKASNRTAFECFNDQDFLAAHRALPGADRVLNRLGGIDPAWGSGFWPRGFDATPDATVNGFVMQADFYKFRGRGVIQTTWRADYKAILSYILAADFTAHPDLAAQRQTWTDRAGALGGDAQLEAILTKSRTEEWDQIFLNPLILAQGVSIDNLAKGSYLSLAHNVDVLSADARTEGSLLHMAARINGGEYPTRVVPMMKGLMCGVADLLGASNAVSRLPRLAAA
jgi:hypothetical protein